MSSTRRPSLAIDSSAVARSSARSSAENSRPGRAARSRPPGRRRAGTQTAADGQQQRRTHPVGGLHGLHLGHRLGQPRPLHGRAHARGDAASTRPGGGTGCVRVLRGRTLVRRARPWPPGVGGGSASGGSSTSSAESMPKVSRVRSSRAGMEPLAATSAAWPATTWVGLGGGPVERRTDAGSGRRRGDRGGHDREHSSGPAARSCSSSVKEPMGGDERVVQQQRRRHRRDQRRHDLAEARRRRPP